MHRIKFPAIFRTNAGTYKKIFKKNSKSSKSRVFKVTSRFKVTTGSKAGIMYGLPKIHKEGNPIRPIISSIGTYTYELSKYLDEIIKPALSNDKFMCRDTVDFINSISEEKLDNENCMASFDVSSLFTNVPVKETINIILDRCFENKESKFHGLSRRQLKELLELCVQKCIFKFNGEYYEQIDGVSMGNPLGPLFANMFMAELEKTHMKKLISLGVLFWRRYVDDIFVTLKTVPDAKKIQDYLNNIHPNIKFTTENEKNQSIPFLDILIKKKRGRLHTEMYRKPTFTGVYLNWHSLTSKKYKTGLISCLLDRVYKICSEPENRDLEIKRIKSLLLKNNYPAQVLDDQIAKFVNKKNVIITYKIDPMNGYKLGATDVPYEETCYIKLPYSGPDVENFSSKLEKLVNSNFKHVRLKVAFSAPSTIGSHFKFKDRIIELEKQSLIVYHIRCNECKEDYIGKTERIFYYRIQEHQKAPKTGEISAIHQHHLKTGHVIDFTGAKILDRADTDRKLQLKELLHIDKRQPTLNKQLISQSEFRINVNIIGSKKK